MSLIKELARLVGFQTSYFDIYGNEIQASEEAFKKLLTTMGLDVDSEQDITVSMERVEQKDWLRLLPHVKVLHAEKDEHGLCLTVDECDTDKHFDWLIEMEDGQKLSGSDAIETLPLQAEKQVGGQLMRRVEMRLPQLPDGYYNLTVTINGESCSCRLIVAPQTCFSPQEAGDFKMWGLAAQLYSMKGEQSWGIGDFGDLGQLVTDSAKRGVSAVGLNPLHPLYPDNPAHCSPYSPTSRSFLNSIYIDVTQVPGYKESEEAQALVTSEAFKNRLVAVNQSQQIDYENAAACKYEVLNILFDHFDETHRKRNTTLAAEFDAFCHRTGDDLNELATFDALYEHFRKINFNAYGWQSWPLEYQNPNSEAVRLFQKEQSNRIRYFKYLQWLADSQLTGVAQQARQNDMAIGLYLDLAVGCDGGGGAEVWSDHNAYVKGAAVGAPPDLLNPLGQDWGLTPINPVTLQEKGYVPFIKALRSNMQYAGALRIDHVFGLMRQYWVAPGMGADEGVFIQFPLDDLLRIIALESRRAHCVVIGEDLGTTPEGFGEIVAKAGLLSYRVLYFERWDSGFFNRPECYPEQAMVTVSTHDLPTLVGWWKGVDLDWRDKLSLYPNAEMGIEERQNRITDRESMLAALEDVGVLDQTQINRIKVSEIHGELPHAVQQFLARSPGRIQLIPMEDALGLQEQVNIPGTIDEHPNWRQKLPYSMNELWEHREMNTLVDVMQRERPLVSKNQ